MLSTIVINLLINSSPSSAAYMRHWIRSALVQIMACILYFSLFPASNCNHYWGHYHFKNIIPFPVKRDFTQFYKKITDVSLPGMNTSVLRNQGLNSIPSYVDTPYFMSGSPAEVLCRYLNPRGYNVFSIEHHSEVCINFPEQLPCHLFHYELKKINMNEVFLPQTRGKPYHM